MIKSPKIYIRDTGILHSLLGIETFNDLLGHPIFGYSWESFVVEQIANAFTDWDMTFYRTATGAELDLILTKGTKKIGIEIKASTAPKLTKGFWNAMETLTLENVWVIAPIEDSFGIHEKVKISSLEFFLQENQA